MLSNADMKPNRYAKWARSKKIYIFMTEYLGVGGSSYIHTAYRTTVIRNPADLKYDRCGVYVRRGKHWDDISYCEISRDVPIGRI